jgi:hypothetical protein
MLYDKRWGKKTALDDASKLLLRAATYIEEYGWCQGVWETKSGAVCASRAITRGIGGISPYLSVALGQAHARLQRHLGGRSIPAWNDDYGNTKENVVKTLRKTARMQD